MTNAINVGIIIVFFVVFYFLIIRPQMTRQRERRELITSIKVGDEIVTIGGVIGTIKELNDDFMLVRTGKDVTLKMSRGAVSSKLTKEKS